MRKILLLSGPDKEKGYNFKVKKIIKNNLNNAKSIICISANPLKYEKNDTQVFGTEKSLGIVKMLKDCDVKLEKIYLLDNRNVDEFDKELFNNVDIIYLMGGDPILQMQFIHNNHLDEKIISSSSFIIGVSAGSMNLAKYTFIPKYELNPTYKFVEGLGICDISIVPHFNINDMSQVDETIKASKEHQLIGLPNDSAIYIFDKFIKYINDYYVYK